MCHSGTFKVHARFQLVQVNGDVFIGRYFDNEEDFKRLDFTAAELSSSAAWISEANKQLQRRSERSGDTQALMQRLQQQQQQQQQERLPEGARQAALVQSPADVEKAKGNQVRKVAVAALCCLT